MDSDELYVLRSRVFVGDKDGALSESQSVMIGTPELRAATSTYTTLADGIIPSPPTGASESLVAALAGLTALSEYDYQKCLQAVSAGSSMLELCVAALAFQGINRMDLAAKKIGAMQSLDDDDALCQITNCWIAGDSPALLQEGSNLLGELIEKFGKTELLLETLGVIHIRQKNFGEAMKNFKEARGVAIAGGHTVSESTMYNSLLCAQYLEVQLGKSGVNTFAQHVENEFRETYPDHPYFANLVQMESSFDHVAKQFK